jgi:hypothetical protein
MSAMSQFVRIPRLRDPARQKTAQRKGRVTPLGMTLTHLQTGDDANSVEAAGGEAMSLGDAEGWYARALRVRGLIEGDRDCAEAALV